MNALDSNSIKNSSTHVETTNATIKIKSGKAACNHVATAENITSFVCTRASIGLGIADSEIRS